MNSQKKAYFTPPHFHPPVDSDLFCPRYRMADRPDLYMWEAMDGTGATPQDVAHHMDNTGPMNRPPIAHSGHGGHGPPLFQPSHHPSNPPTPAPRHQEMNAMGGSAGGGMPGTPTPTPVSNPTTSPLVVPQPMKARTIKTYHCRMCDQIFESKSDLLMHSQQVHKQDPKPYKCPTCNKCFANSSYLSQHARIHSGIKPYKCQICERRFTQLCHLQQHIRTHTGEKPYKCQHPGCGKAFSQLSNLQSHSRSHMTDKPYRCNSCYKCFSDEQSLREHIPKHSETKHIKTHICRICGKAYTQETYLARHMTKHSGDPYTPQGMIHHRNSINNKMNSAGGLIGPAGMTSVGLSHPGENNDIKTASDGMNSSSLPNSSKGGPGGASAFMPLAQFPVPNSGLMNSSVPSTSFPFASPRLPSNTLNSPLSHISPSSASRGYFPFDPISLPKRDPMDTRMSMSREDMIANSLISLQQIKNFSSSHPVFPKSEPSSPVHKEF